MEYQVITQQMNGVWRAFIPALSDLSAEGASHDEAVRNAQQAAAAFLSSVELTTIRVDLPTEQAARSDSPQAWLGAAGKFKGDDEAMSTHLEVIYADRRRERVEVERELDEEAHRIASSAINEDAA
jgi:predicted RNase H-like HicB family nuclease